MYDDDDDDDDDLLDPESDELLVQLLRARRGSSSAPPPPTARSPHLPRARAILERWESAGKLELEEGCDRDALAEALLERLVALEGHRHLGSHLAEWLMERPEVADVFASDDELERDVR